MTCSSSPKGSKISWRSFSVTLKCMLPTYRRWKGAPLAPGAAPPSEGRAARFFSASVSWAMMGTPFSFWPVSSSAWGTDASSLNST
ncbi:hypothetical protein IG631_09155 [Alternaria alternata]|nr:hypothetical protein IG631_09155 [Alternaria alternata]